MNDFQERVHLWVVEVFGINVAIDSEERKDRFLEEAIELVQANGGKREDAHALVDYVFSRPTGEIKQEVGGVIITLAALCNIHGIMIQECGEQELARIWDRIDEIRNKHNSKFRGSPLP